MSLRFRGFGSGLAVSALIVSGLMASRLVSLINSVWAIVPLTPPTAQLLEWQDLSFFVLPSEPDPAAENIMHQYLENWSAKGAQESKQGVWIHSGLHKLATHQSTVPLPAASLTKIATTIAVLDRWEPTHQFETLVGATGTIKEGVLQGDLVINGGGDPFFIWQEAIALGNSLEELGIRRVDGNLLIVDDFYLNYQKDSETAGQLLRQGINSRLWSPKVTRRHLSLPPGTPKPQVEITGQVKVLKTSPAQHSLFLRHRSLSLAEILRQMNIYSNNDLSELLANSVGGAPKTAQLAAKYAGVPQEEIQLINGSGLGVANRISPRAAVAMLMAVERFLQPHQLSLADLLPMAGRDQGGTMLERQIPIGSAVKTGTLRQVSALAGVIPTRDRGLVWFAIINGGGSFWEFRTQQDKLLGELSEQWGTPESDHIKITATPVLLGDPLRNEEIRNEG